MSLLKLLTCFALVLLIGGLSAPWLFADELADKFEKTQFKTADGQTLLYRFLAPSKTEAGKKYPLAVNSR